MVNKVRMWLALSLAVVIVLAVSGLALARDAISTPALNVPDTVNELDPDTAGFYRVTNKRAFLQLTGSLRGTLSYGEWMWRAGVGAVNYWWMDATATDLFLVRKRGWSRSWNPDEPVGPYNYLGLVVSIPDYQQWIWCGVPLYDERRRFVGYGCHPEYGPIPEGEGELAPWMVAYVEESQPVVWTVLGAMCVLQRSEHMEIQPPCPDSDDDIRILLFGDYGNSCPDVNYTVSRDGTDIKVEGTIASSGEFCSSVITSWTKEEEVGTLPAETYTISATVTDEVSGYWGFEDTLVFDVLPAEVDSDGE